MPFPRLFIIVFLLPFYSISVSAQNTEQNKVIPRECPIPNYQKLNEPTLNLQDDGIVILSNITSIEKAKYANFSGAVTMFNDKHTIKANSVTIDRNKETVNAEGDIHFQNDGVDIFARDLNISQALNTTSLTDTKYQLVGLAGHGNAENIIVSKDGEISLQTSSFTTCYGETPDWQMHASEINISNDEKYLEAYNARFSLFDVPVFYLPYFYLPIGDERQSGFLFPEIGSSGSSGFISETPYYWNIAENMDATFTPRVMSKRGTQLLTEFRYLHNEQTGQFDFEYLNEDKELVDNNDARYLARMQHIGNFSDNFRAYVDYTAISDDNYLVDIGSKHYNSNDAYLYQIGHLSYFGDSWQATVKVQDFEVLGNNKASYKTTPQLEITSQQPLGFWNGQFKLYSELTNFETPIQEQASAQRYHAEAGVLFPIMAPAYFLNSEFTLLQTNYQQDDIPAGSELDKTVSRTIPKVRFHGGINFDRETSFFGQRFTHTIEPQLQYLYVPEKEQSNIGVYDTTELQDDYNGLFRDKRFSGLDRIAKANQFTWGLTTRLLDNANKEQMRFSLGRIIYINDSNIAHDAEQGISASESALAAEVYARINRQWQFSSDIQYNTDLDVTNKSQTSLDYLFNKNQTIQLNHRYTRDVSGYTLEQLSLATNVRINKNWQLIGRVTQDLQLQRSIETYTGFQYESCCWSVSFAYHRYINANFDEQTVANENRDEFDSGFMIRFTIGAQNIEDMYNSSIFGYKRPYFLNN